MSDNYMKLALYGILVQLKQSQAELARHCRVSRATINLICKFDQWPKSAKSNQTTLRPLIEEFLRCHGATDEQVLGAFEPLFEGAHPLCSSTACALYSQGQKAKNQEDDMNVRHSRLTSETRQHFRILKDPFVDELRSIADVFESDDIRYVRAAVRQTALHGGMLALVAESGAGKSTIRKDLIEWIKTTGERIEVIEPYVVATSAASKAGRLLVAADIVGAVIRSLAPNKPVRSSLEARTHQMHQMLKEGASDGRKHVVVIEEAHDLAIPTLKALKRFYEQEDGFKKLLSIILVGQNELADKLSEKDPEVREVVQRCELITLPPLDNNLGAYLQHKFKRVEADMANVLESEAIDAIRAVLRRDETRSFGGKRTTKNVSKCHPLAVNNLVTRAMNMAAGISAKTVNAALIHAAFQESGNA
ncbi:ExeA family protein [Comamonas thiooxydans]|uniref:ExeA family protein n=1 Tax=Comamonas thiooxydans TaxID=363952 RepID=UPI00209BD2EC|nr:AAA family ATPase [Comamonas thiooxydans]MCO8248509.1 AAA family ATPase [Comamonas thiooxydans]